ncbi:MAG: acetolactate decarboxylase [Saprospiraceae bacterium]
MRKTMRLLTIFLFSMTGIISNSSAMSVSVTDTIRYQCPMKCEGEKTYDHPGACPVCGMDLEKLEANDSAIEKVSNVKITGAMLNVMHLGLLYGTINLDTIANKKHLYGLGPLEYLKGEILIDDGKSFISKVAADGSIAMEETYKVKAPFFVSENVDKWEEVSLPEYIQTIPQLETFLDATTKDHSRPFAFRVTTTIENAAIHIVNLPDGTTVSSPEDVQQHQHHFIVKNTDAELIGFFSTQHQGIFTHHDTYVHIHLITSDKKKMGHVESFVIKKGTAKLFLPAE